jgi:hypothetical protein
VNIGVLVLTAVITSCGKSSHTVQQKFTDVSEECTTPIFGAKDMLNKNKQEASSKLSGSTGLGYL